MVHGLLQYAVKTCTVRRVFTADAYLMMVHDDFFSVLAGGSRRGSGAIHLSGRGFRALEPGVTGHTVLFALVVAPTSDAVPGQHDNWCIQLIYDAAKLSAQGLYFHFRIQVCATHQYPHRH